MVDMRRHSIVITHYYTQILKDADVNLENARLYICPEDDFQFLIDLAIMQVGYKDYEIIACVEDWADQFLFDQN